MSGLVIKPENFFVFFKRLFFKSDQRMVLKKVADRFQTFKVCYTENAECRGISGVHKNLMHMINII